MNYRPKVVRCRLKTGGKSIPQIREECRGQGLFLAYVGTPTATVIGFYSWKAKAENVVKIKKANPEETEGMPVDLNNVQP